MQCTLKHFLTLLLSLGSLASGPLLKAAVFSNTAPITIVDGAPANPYSSVIAVSGMAGTVSGLTVTINNLSHDYVADLSLILQAPSGQALLLQSGFADGFTVSNITYTFSDAAASQASSTANLVSGTYKPTAFFWDIWDAPAPGTPPGLNTYNPPGPFGPSGTIYSTLGSTFNGLAPNGNWKLWAADFSATGDPGLIAGGWTLNINTSIVTPVELNHLNVAEMGCKPLISWSTNQELNSDYFDIERKEASTDFIKVATIKAVGNKKSMTDYYYKDINAEKSYYEYRLKMVDMDGQFGYSPSKDIHLSCDQTVIELFPNPSKGNTTLLIRANQEDVCCLKLTDLYGRTLFQSTIGINVNENRIQLPMQSFADGVYLLSLEGEYTHHQQCLHKN